MATKKTTKRKSKKLEPNFRERVSYYIDDEKKLLEKYGLLKHIVVLFPQHRKPPLLGKLAVKLLRWSGGAVDAQFIDKEQNHG